MIRAAFGGGLFPRFAAPARRQKNETLHLRPLPLLRARPHDFRPARRGGAADFLQNDDEATPIRMIGAKQLPILEKDDGTFMGESLDIVRHIDETAGKGRLKEAVRPEIQAWLDKVGQYANKLIQPRDVLAGFPEFATPSAVAYFTERKQKLIRGFRRKSGSDRPLSGAARCRPGGAGTPDCHARIGRSGGDGRHPAVPAPAQPHHRARPGAAAENGGLRCGGVGHERRAAFDG